MAIKISEINDRTLEVNGKSIFKDSNGNWVAQIPLNTAEKKAFSLHIKAKSIKKD